MPSEESRRIADSNADRSEVQYHPRNDCSAPSIDSIFLLKLNANYAA